MSSLGRAIGTPMIAALLLGLAGNLGAAERYKLASEGEIRGDWALADGVKLSVPSYPAAFANRGENVCIALGYAINPDGTTSDFSLLKSWSSGSGEMEPMPGYWNSFAQAGANSVAQWKFKPRVGDSTPRATYTVATLYFTGAPAIKADALRDKCAIGDLAAYAQERKAEDSRTSLRQQMVHDRLRNSHWRMEEAVAARERRLYHPVQPWNKRD